MKKLLSLSLFLFGLTTAGAASAGVTKGFVLTQNIGGGLTQTTATFNVATNPASGHTNSKFSVGASDLSVRFSSFDAPNSRSFLCFYYPSNPDFVKATHIAQNVGPGTYLIVQSSGSTCTKMTIFQDSTYQ